MELVGEYATPLPTLVIAEMLGVPLEDRPRFMRWSDAIMGLSYSVTGGEAAQRMIAAHAAVKAEIDAYLVEQIEARRRAPREDLLTRLVGAEVDGERLSPEDIRGFFQLLLAAGTETTTNLITNAILAFLDFPGELARLRADPSLLPSAIEEVLRFRSPAQMMFRETRRDVELGGKTIPAGKLLLVMIGSANRDPAVFPEPDRFDIARHPNPHIAFGHGIHFCIGAPLARLEARVALGHLLERLDGIELADEGLWKPRKALLAYGPAELPIRFRLRT
jgi:cytochrome P450